MAKRNSTRTTVTATVETPVEATPVETPVEATPVETPVEATPVANTATVDAHAAAMGYLRAFDPSRLPPGVVAGFIARGNVTRMGIDALRAKGIEPGTDAHRAYNELRSGFWRRMAGGLPPRADGAPRTASTGTRGTAGTGVSRPAKLRAFAARIEGAVGQLTSALAGAPAGDLPELLAARQAVTQLVAALAGLDDAALTPPAAVKAAPAKLTAGGRAVLTPAGRRQLVEDGLIGEGDAVGEFEIVSLPTDKIAVVRGKSGDRARLPSRFLAAMA